jgi:hypothetical protein
LRGQVSELETGRLLRITDAASFRKKYPDEKVVAKHDPSPAIITRYLAQRPGLGTTLGVDVQTNTWPAQVQTFVGDLRGNIRFWEPEKDWTGAPRNRAELFERRAIWIDNPSQRDLVGPVSAPGAGLGWLAVPIPFLGATGLLLLWGLMGRRGVLHWLLYGLLAGAAMIATITPFTVGQAENQMFNFNAVGMVYTPFPGFENLMMVSLHELMVDYLSASIILALLLSAGVPWLLTALFLKPGSSPQQFSGPELAA